MRHAAWLPGKTPVEIFDNLVLFSSWGLQRHQIASYLGTTDAALSSYFTRYGITMQELRDAAAARATDRNRQANRPPMQSAERTT